MSDFDKEAERERLREKYGDEYEDREATQQMSELLLQGATMTNRHCQDCGDPIFRHQGQEFCPTCGAGTGEGEGQGKTQEQTEGQEEREPADAADPPEGQSPPQAQARSQSRADTSTAQTGPAEPRPGAEAAREGSGDERSTPTSERETARAVGPPRGVDAEDASEGGIRAAQESLVRTLARFARRAEATDDPRAAREHLAAAREAAEALAALRR